jgi:hypothetical protein
MILLQLLMIDRFCTRLMALRLTARTGAAAGVDNTWSARVAISIPIGSENIQQADRTLQWR